MFEFLSAYLEVTVTPELKRVYLNACQTLVDHGVTDHVFALDQELAIADSLDSDVVLDSISGILLPIYRSTLGEFGIVLNDQATLAQAADVFQALATLENYDDQETINGLCDGPDGPEAALADLLQLTGSYTAAEYLPLFESVSDELIDRIAELNRQENLDELPPEEFLDNYRTRLHKLYGLAAAQTRPSLRIEALLEDGTRLGLPYEEYTVAQRTYLDTCEPQLLALELMGLLLASSLAENGILKAAAAELELLHLEQLKMTATHVAITKLYNQIFGPVVAEPQVPHA